MDSVNIDSVKAHLVDFLSTMQTWLQSPAFYAQIGLIFAALVLALALSKVFKRSRAKNDQVHEPGTMQQWRSLFRRLHGLLFPLFAVILLGLASSLSDQLVGQSWLVRIMQGLAVVALVYSAISEFAREPIVRNYAKWVIIPIAVLYVFGWLDDTTAQLDSIRLEVGNITISLFAIARVLIFGSILFWLGRKSNDSGKQFIRGQEQLEIGTREVFAKLFEILLFLVIFFLILQVMGINVTTLAVFGGALGVGIGFGLQAIASNFISGLILLLDRSLTVGDYVELDDGRAGTIRALNMRSAILETYDGKDIVVPNETFITSTFINWTHKDIRQRYSMEFQIAYSSDLEKAIEVIKEVVISHPQVISGPDVADEEKPDAEISGFGDSGVDILVEYWMEGIDDGKNRVDADLYMLLWKAFKKHDIEIPFPQREVRVLNPTTDSI